MRKLTYYIATSIDGFIGGPSGDADFFTPYAIGDFQAYMKAECPDALPTAARRALGVDDVPNRHFDTVIQGRASYDIALALGVTSPYAHLRQYVVSHSLEKSPDPDVELVRGDVAAAVRGLKQQDGLGIYLCGGANLAGQLTDEIDELVIKTYPVVLGSGMPMFAADFRISEFTLESVRSFDAGVHLTRYARKR
ncbi:MULTISPECIES: dihydrofolate reductase family protein [Streptomyces]|uniref:Dihydrofolate reductase family protein n=1 Tax=Streptomyces chengmaiensis TaxID=3040919 RepID=A0ABT6HFZ9_9ACTN|nr:MULTISPECIES: dihydrofolate reductase family protein [Streptomyces]MDH2387500.1 dihydrofolate reductase family protein [Streptomyces chengmaiensis]WRQ81351.1 dihydrofolate reductase family protein [Streptomyces sp. MUM 178J]